MKILVIEDDREAADYLKKALAEAGHNAHVAFDAYDEVIVEPASRLREASDRVVTSQFVDNHIQVGIEDAGALQRAKPDAKLALIDGMNHVLRIVPANAQQLASYDDPDLPLAWDLQERIRHFLQANGILPASS